MGRVRPAVILVASLLVVAGTYLTAALFRDGDTTQAPIAGERPASELAPMASDLLPGGAEATLPAGSAAGSVDQTEVDRLIGVFEARILDHTDALDYQFLGNLYLIKARLTGEVALYERASEVLEMELQLWPSDLDGTTMLGRARLALHDFAGAMELAGHVLAADPGRLDALALDFDARLALGDLGGADAAYQQLAQALPDHPAILVRQSTLAFTTGDGEAAAVLARQAVLNAGPSDPNQAWYRTYLGHVEFDLGNHGRAATAYESALHIDAEYGAALAGMAEVRAAQGNIDDAIDLYSRAVAGIADPDSLAALGDLYFLLGDVDQAEAHWQALVAMTEGVGAYRHDLAAFYANHDRNIEEALRLAAKELELRRDVDTHDNYAWALYRSGDLDAARQASENALSLGTPEAEFWYHAGLISAGLGDKARAVAELQRALEINPAFHPLMATHAREVLDSLSG